MTRFGGNSSQDLFKHSSMRLNKTAAQLEIQTAVKFDVTDAATDGDN